ncbi:MAG TPA: PAS-domain containing protein [Zoogloea sp.]|uniref:PAS-domain containing protein n=1 Tax=Zoogloea sp. TaxID=49181 RepID=UPI002D05E31F|nr:PAS-domain containing protein [Zoogloea sp.]HMV18158.1 PAS-domain containing protein [Rhodocyclaceae bacterium]HMV64074.1 PAS-domain containing protein [Rhodocyclaceae bacterium]HMW52620.1 PAS-domain containing protein [Rhodocyclaceae bacterium]HMY50110.1 PAS-domain containing protein [Rhodocyclaceae bacterium]HMZ76685.1 PAS-domain containing protein [Rhodocyclaceae bacterium]
MIGRIAPGARAAAGSPEELRRYDLLLAGFDLLDQAIAVFDAAPRLVTWNTAMLRLLDFPEELVRVGTPFEDFVRFNVERGEYGPGETERLIAERMAAVRAFQPHQAERTRPNGQILAIRGVPIPNLGFVTLWTDVTEQRRYEKLIEGQNAELETRVRARTAELEAANRDLTEAKSRLDSVAAQLSRSEERLRLIMDAIPALIAYVDAGERYRFANRGYAQWFGLDKNAIVGRSIAEVFGPDAYAQIKPHLETAADGERVSYEYTRTDASGRQVFARSAVVPDTSEAGGVQGYFVLSIDITEQKASQAALIQAQKMEAVGQLTGGLAHDFNNLLTIITGNLHALRDKLPAHQGYDDYLEPALSAAGRGTELIRRLLSFSRQQPLEPRAIEVGVLVTGMGQLLSRTLTEHIRLQLDLPTRKLHVLADPHQLENALLNLALNARDAMPDGGELRIAVAPRHISASLSLLVEVPAGEYVQFDVSDTGTGIDPALLPRLFEPFFTTKRFGAGSGLGLAMVYGFVRQSGGNIRILSTPGKGTNVRFILPMTEAPAPRSDQPPARAAHHDAPRGLVLLVEDEPEVRKVIREQLTELGYPVLEAANGIEAAAMLEAVDDIAVLVSDTVMPGLGGRELAARARRLRPQLPILLITGYATQAPADGPDLPTLRKPFDRSDLAAALDALHRPEPAAP